MLVIERLEGEQFTIGDHIDVLIDEIVRDRGAVELDVVVDRRIFGLGSVDDARHGLRLRVPLRTGGDAFRIADVVGISIQRFKSMGRVRLCVEAPADMRVSWPDRHPTKPATAEARVVRHVG